MSKKELDMSTTVAVPDPLKPQSFMCSYIFWPFICDPHTPHFAPDDPRRRHQLTKGVCGCGGGRRLATAVIISKEFKDYKGNFKPP